MDGSTVQVKSRFRTARVRRSTGHDERYAERVPRVCGGRRPRKMRLSRLRPRRGRGDGGMGVPMGPEPEPRAAAQRTAPKGAPVILRPALFSGAKDPGSSPPIRFLGTTGVLRPEIRPQNDRAPRSSAASQVGRCRPVARPVRRRTVERVTSEEHGASPVELRVPGLLTGVPCPAFGVRSRASQLPCSHRAFQVQDPRFKMRKKRIPSPVP